MHPERCVLLFAVTLIGFTTFKVKCDTYDECFTKFNSKHSSLFKIFQDENPSENDKCAGKCILEEQGYIKSDGEIDIDYSKKDHLEGLKHSKSKEEMLKFFDECLLKLTEYDDQKSCGAIFDYAKCCFVRYQDLLKSERESNSKTAEADEPTNASQT